MPALGSPSHFLLQPELVERLIVVDISPVESTSSSNFPNYVAAMKAIDLPNGASLSSARKLASEKLSSVVQVMHPRS